MTNVLNESGATVELSIMTPVYLGADCVQELVDQVGVQAAAITSSYEIILVEDGSPDESWSAIRAACAKDKRVKGVRLSRNFGQHYALTAGLAVSRGRYVIVMDCDLQDDPVYLPTLYQTCRDGYDVVYTRKQERRHVGVKDLASKGFHRLLNSLVGSSQQKTDSHVGNYTCLTRQVVDAFLSIKDYHRHYLGVLRWLGFRSTHVDIEHKERPVGETSYTFRKLLREAINGITSQSDRLLYTSVVVGLVFFLLAMAGATFVLVRAFTVGFGAPGWASVFVLLLTSTGLILMSLGVLGIYVGKVFEQAKGRPLFVIEEFLNNDTEAAADDVEEPQHELLAKEP